MTPSTQLQAVATLAARRAGEHVLANLHRRGDVNSVLRTDVKHKLDVEAQETATAVIQAAYPNHAVFGEETCEEPFPENDTVWIIDPIDGTINFFHGLPWWCCSVGVRHQGQAVASAVFLPEMRQMYEATYDGPALCNGAPIHVSDTGRPELAMLATGADKWDLGEHAFRFMRKVSEIAQRPRILGAAAVDMCLVAAGKLDGYFESGIYLWDMAAASLIVERAGGRCETLKAYPKHRVAFLATNGHLHDACRDALLPLLNV
jgi:myo-inositol-1(or 4)-monophosphatase